MTIFLQIAREILSAEIIALREASVVADNSVTNTVVSVASLGYFGRDKGLSKAKRDYNDDLLFKLKEVKDGENDAATLEALIQLVTSCKKLAGSESHSKGYNEGTTGPAMEKIIGLLQTIHTKFQSLEEEQGIRLLNIPCDDQSLNCFRHQAGRYIAQKIVDASKVTFVSWFLTHPKISSCLQLAEKKEELLVASLKKAEVDVGNIERLELKDKQQRLEKQRQLEEERRRLEEERRKDKEQDVGEVSAVRGHPLVIEEDEQVDYESAKKERVLVCLEKLQGANIILCKQYGPKINIPVTVGLFSTLSFSVPTLHPKGGFLENCVEKALNKINPPELVEQKGLVV